MKNKPFVFFMSLILLITTLSGTVLVSASGLKGSDIAVDYRKIAGFKTEADYIDYLGQLLDGLNGDMPSDSAKAKLALYIETAVSALASVTLKSNDNSLVISDKNLNEGIGAAKNAKTGLEELLRSRGIAVNKAVSEYIRIDSTGFDLSEPCQVTFSAAVLDIMDSSEYIQLLLNDNRHAVSISADSLKSIIAKYGALIIQFQRADFHEYKIIFVDAEGKSIAKIPVNVGFALPSDSELATVLADYSGGSDNWGGQYDSANGVIEFSTRYSGNYEVLESTVNMSDIGSLSDEEQSMIRFMVSKGYFTSAGNAFKPSERLSRYDFTAALVKMFFALDRETQSDFTDVPKGSVYYAYVSSAKADNIVKGAGESKFNGELSISKVEVVALCARTLAEKKGYSYPENISEYLQFSDKDELGDWALNDVALAVREGLIPADGTFNPNSSLSRSDSALILYKLFMLLYETSPVSFSGTATPDASATASNTTAAPAAADDGLSIRSIMNMVVTLLLVLAIAGFIILMLIFVKKKKKR